MNFLRHRAWLILALTLLFAAAVRWRLRDLPLERDEGEYAYAGQLLLQGVAPYKEAYNMKLPGTYAAYALIMAVFGQTPAGIHFGVLLVNAGSILLMFLLGCALLDEAAGVAAAVSFALLSLSPAVLGLAGHATHFVVLPALGGILLLLKGVHKVSRAGPALAVRDATVGGPKDEPPAIGTWQPAILNWPLFFSGVLFGTGFLMKQHGIFFGLFGGLYIVWTRVAPWWESRKERDLGRGPGRGGRSRARRDGRDTIAARKGVGLGPSGSSPSAGELGHPMPAQPRLSHFAAGKLRQASNEAPPPNTPPPQKPDDPAAAAGFEKPGLPGAESITANLASPRGPGQGGTPSIQSPADRELESPGRALPGFELHFVVRDLLVFAVGIALPYGATCLLLWAAGVFPQFAFWTIAYAQRYVSQHTLVDGPALLRLALRAAVGPNVLLWLLPWIGALVMWWEGRLAQRPKAKVRTHSSEIRGPRLELAERSAVPHARVFLVALFFCSCASVSVGLHFREHYFITLLPVLSLLSGVAVSRAVYLVKYDRTIELFLAVAILVGSVAAVGWALIGNGAAWFALTPAEVIKETYLTTLFNDAARLAGEIKADTPAGARIAVLGSEPEICFYAGRRSATGYIYMYPMLERHEFALKMQRDMIAQIERARPEYVVYVKDGLSWGEGDRSLIDEWWERYWPANLEMIKTIEIEKKRVAEGSAGTQIDTGTLPVEEQKLLFVLRRKR